MPWSWTSLRPDSVRDAVQAHLAAHGGLDCLVNCAGVIHLAPLAEITEADWDRTIDVDLKGTFLCSQAAAPHLTACGRGRIVNIGSDASRAGFPLIPHYCAAKHGVIGLTKALAGELAPGKVTVNCVCPVGVPTTGMGQKVLRWKMEATGSAPEEIQQATAASIPARPQRHRGGHRARDPVLSQRRGRVRHRIGARRRWRHDEHHPGARYLSCRTDRGYR